MADDPRISGLLEQMICYGLTAEEACRDCPELLPRVRERWQVFGRIDAEYQALFPEPEPEPGTPADPAASGIIAGMPGLPEVPGYTIEAELGRGGMGVVYRAWHLRLQRPVAVKMLLSGAYAQPAERERFLREAEAVAA